MTATVGTGLLAVDPGNVTGWAVFYPGAFLSSAGADSWKATPFRLNCLLRYPGTYTVIEKPQVYTTQYSKGDPNDLIDLALKVGQLMAWYPNHELVLPRQWKGQLSKTVCWNRALEVLTPQELSIIKGSDHNMRDAIALGLWKLGRLKLT